MKKRIVITFFIILIIAIIIFIIYRNLFDSEQFVVKETSTNNVENIQNDENTLIAEIPTEEFRNKTR